MPDDKRLYYEKLKDPRWQRKRLEVFERAGWRCENCDCEHIELHAHHIAYEWGREPWDYPFSMLKCLCDPCHSRTEEAISRLRKAFKGFTWEQIDCLAEQLETAIDRFGPQTVFYVLLEVLPQIQEDGTYR